MNQEEARETGSIAKNDRILALSDGLFAFAMTLLVLGLQVPTRDKISPAQLPRYVLSLHSSFLVWVISFLVIGSFWLGHHRLFDLLEGHDQRLAWLNLLLLLSIAFLPFPTGLIGQYGDTRFAVVFYAGSLFFSASVFMLMTWDASHDRRLLRKEASDEAVRVGLVRGATMQCVCLISIFASFVSLTAAIWSWLLIPVAQRLAVTVSRRLAAS